MGSFLANRVVSWGKTDRLAVSDRTLLTDDDLWTTLNTGLEIRWSNYDGLCILLIYFEKASTQRDCIKLTIQIHFN
jgi:hypothetical protein